MPSNRGSSSRRHDDRRDRDNDFEFNIANNPGVTRNLGRGDDTVEVRGALNQVRITFTSAEVGNGDPFDGSAVAPQDGGLAVRVQAEDAAGGLVGPVSRFDDEGITFTTRNAALFDVRDLVTGASRGLFDEVILGTDRDDELGDDDMTAAAATTMTTAADDDDAAATTTTTTPPNPITSTAAPAMTKSSAGGSTTSSSAERAMTCSSGGRATTASSAAPAMT